MSNILLYIFSKLQKHWELYSEESQAIGVWNRNDSHFEQSRRPKTMSHDEESWENRSPDSESPMTVPKAEPESPSSESETEDSPRGTVNISPPAPAVSGPQMPMHAMLHPPYQGHPPIVHGGGPPVAFDHTGHLLPTEDVEVFFNSLERPTATSVSVAGVYPVGSGGAVNLTTLTNPSMSGNQSPYQAPSGGNLITMQPPSYTDSQSTALLHAATMPPLYASSRQMIPVQYGSSHNTPQSNSLWTLPPDSVYASPGQSAVGQRYYTTSSSVAPNHNGRADPSAPLAIQFPRTPGLSYSYVGSDVAPGWNSYNLPPGARSPNRGNACLFLFINDRNYWPILFQI